MWSKKKNRKRLGVVRRLWKTLAKAASSIAHRPSDPRHGLFDRLPTEMLSLVFVHGALLDRLPGKDIFICSEEHNATRQKPLQFAAVVSLVCTHWRAVALSTPALWSKITTRERNPDDLGWVCEQLKRSRNFPVQLSIPFYEFEPTDSDAALSFYETYGKALKRCSTLVVSSTSTSHRPWGILPDFLMDRDRAPMLETLQLEYPLYWDIRNGPVPELDAPRLRYAALKFNYPKFLHTYSMLRSVAATLHLLELSFTRMHVDNVLLPYDVLEFPSLCHLSVSSPRKQLLSKFLAPRLRTLCFTGLCLPTHMPPLVPILRNVTHFQYATNLPADGTREMYSILPSLQVLEVSEARRAHISYLSADSSDPAGLVPCPQLHTMTIRSSRYESDYWNHVSWEDIHNLARERHARGAPIRQMFLDPPPDAERSQIELLSQFVADVRVCSELQDEDGRVVQWPRFTIEDCSGCS